MVIIAHLWTFLNINRLTSKLDKSRATDHRPKLIGCHTRIIPSISALIWESDDEISSGQTVMIIHSLHNINICVV